MVTSGLTSKQNGKLPDTDVGNIVSKALMVLRPITGASASNEADSKVD